MSATVALAADTAFSVSTELSSGPDLLPLPGSSTQTSPSQNATRTRKNMVVPCPNPVRARFPSPFVTGRTVAGAIEAAVQFLRRIFASFDLAFRQI